MVGFLSYVIASAVPLYVANATAMIFGGKTPLDFHAIFVDGKPLFGKGKTWKGSGMGILLGTFSGILLEHFFSDFTNTITPYYWEYAFLLSFGAIAGDVAGSFLKRRMQMESGKPAPLLDQLDFVVGGMVFGLMYVQPSLVQAGLLVLLTLIMHSLFNRVAFILKLKSVPW